jgi:hypothetical protein
MNLADRRRFVTPAKAGVQEQQALNWRHWIPAFAGMTQDACAGVTR